MQGADAIAARLARSRQRAALRGEPAVRLAGIALAGLLVAVIAVAGLVHASEPRGEAGVSLAAGSRPGVVEIRNDSAASFAGRLVIGNGAATSTVAVSLRAGQAAEVRVPGTSSCRAPVEVRLQAADAGSTGVAEAIAVPCGSAAP